MEAYCAQQPRRHHTNSPVGDRRVKTSPLRIKGFEYPTVCVRASTNFVEDPDLSEQIPVTVKADVNFDADGKHFAIINVEQTDDKYAYTFEFEAFTVFEIDAAACKESFSDGVNPSMLAVNAARLLYSGIRELLASITARAPYGIATLPSTTLGKEDVSIRFEKDKRDEILANFFSYSPEQIEAINKRLKAAKAAEKPSARVASKRVAKPRRKNS